MRLPIRATRPIPFEVSYTQLSKVLWNCLGSLGTSYPWQAGVFYSEEVPIDLKDVKGQSVTKFTFQGEVASEWFSDPNALIEFFFNRETKTITLRFNPEGIGAVWASIRPSTIKDLYLPLFVHEITHLLDQKSLADARKQEKMENLEQSKKFHIYYNLDIEVRAYLRQVSFHLIDPLFRKGIPKESPEDLVELIKDRLEYRQLIDYLTPENRKKFWKGVITRYQDLLGNEDKRKKALAAHTIMDFEK